MRREKLSLEAVPFELTAAEESYLRLVCRLLDTIDRSVLAGGDACGR